MAHLGVAVSGGLGPESPSRERGGSRPPAWPLCGRRRHPRITQSTTPAGPSILRAAPLTGDVDVPNVSVAVKFMDAASSAVVLAAIQGIALLLAVYQESDREATVTGHLDHSERE